MSDVEIVFPQGREAVVRRLRDALTEAGYDVDSREVGESDGASAASDTSAILILWDRSTMAHPGLEAAAAAARKRDRAIDVSVDGITPLGMNDDRALVQLSGWRGDPHHPGWRKILARLEQLCHARRAPVMTRQAAPAAASAVVPGGSAPPRAGRAIWAAAAGIIVLIVVVAALLLPGRSPPASAPAPGAEPGATASQPAPTAPADQTTTGTELAPASPPSAAPAPQPSAEPAAAVPPATEQVSGPVAPDQAVAALVPHKRPAARAKAPAHRSAVRYTRYSRTMRLFCARAGRSTPQCRTFNQATGR